MDKKTFGAFAFALILPGGLGYAGDLEWTAREIKVAPGTVITNNRHVTDRWITVAAGTAEYRDVQGTKALRAGDKLFIPGGLTHSLTVGNEGVVLQAEGLADHGTALDSCGAGM